MSIGADQTLAEQAVAVRVDPADLQVRLGLAQPVNGVHRAIDRGEVGGVQRAIVALRHAG